MDPQDVATAGVATAGRDDEIAVSVRRHRDRREGAAGQHGADAPALLRILGVSFAASAFGITLGRIPHRAARIPRCKNRRIRP